MTRPAGRLAAVAAVAGPLAALLDVGENLALRQVLDCLARPAGTCAGENGWAAAAQALAFAKFVLVVPAVAVAVVAVVTALWRLTRHAVDRPAPPGDLDEVFPQPDPAAEGPPGGGRTGGRTASCHPGGSPAGSASACPEAGSARPPRAWARCR
ncbi:MAG TPA: hypothetical protein VKP11_07510 [Frankiaceae bacterium]|nr:hypothetical protein [Frankiaceae bacterium]